VAVALDQDRESPFFHRIKRLGTAAGGRCAVTITQATFVEALLPFISDSPKEDRDASLCGQSLVPASPQELERLPFRNMFIQERDLHIAEIVFNYFTAVRAVPKTPTP
jgi:hypothetical protein